MQKSFPVRPVLFTALFAWLLTVSIITVSQTHGAPFTPAAWIAGVMLFVKGLGIWALARGMMLLGTMFERHRATSAWDRDLMGKSVVHSLGGASTFVALPMALMLARVL